MCLLVSCAADHLNYTCAENQQLFPRAAYSTLAEKHFIPLLSEGLVLAVLDSPVPDLPSGLPVVRTGGSLVVCTEGWGVVEFGSMI
jgi:hypothetical protein